MKILFQSLPFIKLILSLSLLSKLFSRLLFKKKHGLEIGRETNSDFKYLYTVCIEREAVGIADQGVDFLLLKLNYNVREDNHTI